MPYLRHLAALGSSPLTRGKLSDGTRHVVHAGLIPTHAGKTLTGMVADTDTGAHPHSRGENRGSP